MRRAAARPNISLAVPPPQARLAKFLTQSGTFKDGDLLVNKDGIRIIHDNDERETPLIRPSDNHLALADMEMVKEIGRGSGGNVRLVRHQLTGQFFALKVILMDVEESLRKRIAQELKINLSSQSPFVVVCYQCFYDKGAISIVLEYMDVGSLADFLKKVKSIPEPYLAAICKQVLKGLIYLHYEKHVIHRDLKPSNILINHRGEVKISDFGVSAILASCSTQRDSFVGTYTYMSPERISAEKHGYISDVWSLGLVMLQCATGQFPYPPVENFYELLEAVVDQPAPCAPADQFSEEFCSFISSCVHKNPKNRQSARALLRHPFLSMYEDLKVDLASYFTNAGPPLATF